MNGLECSEIMYSYVIKGSDIFRIDSFYYKKEFLREEYIIDTMLNTSIYELPNAKILSFGAYSLNNYVEYLDEGIPFIRCVNMKNGIINNTDILYISEEVNRLLHKSAIYPETVLLSMSGSIGNVAVALPEWKYPINSNQDIAKIHLNGDLNPYYLYSFLRCKFGNNYMLREARGSVQQHVFLSQIEKFKIPIVSSIFAKHIEIICKKAFVLLHDADKQYTFSEQILLKSLNMDNFVPSQQNTTTKSLSQFMNAGRLDAEYFHPKYDDIEEKIKVCSNGYVALGDVAENIDTGEYAEDYTDKSAETVYYVRGTNMQNGRIEKDYTHCVEKIYFTKILEQGDIITTRVGSVGIFAEVTEDLAGAVFSDNVIRFKLPKEYTPSVYVLLLNSAVINELIMRYARGSVQQRMNQETLKNIKLPIVNIAIQKDIEKKIDKSFELRAKSNELLEGAKRAVEIAIEEDEETAMQYLAQFECIGKEV